MFSQECHGESFGSLGARREEMCAAHSGPHSELLFFLIKKEPTIHREVVDFERDTASDIEDGKSFSCEVEEHNVENFMWCSFCAVWVQSDPAGFPAR